MILTKDKSFYVKMMRLAPAIALQSLAAFSLGLTDSIMISALGDSATAGVYMANQIQSFLQMMSVGIEGALLVLAAQQNGGGDGSGARKTAFLGFAAALLLSASIAVPCLIAPRPLVSLFSPRADVAAAGAEYLRLLAFSFVPFAVSQALGAAQRSVGRPGVGALGALVAFSLNASLNYALIFGRLGMPRLGIRGAAISTLAARLGELIAVSLCVIVIERRTRARESRLFPSLDRGLVRSFFKNGAPLLLGQAIWALNLFFSAALIGHLPAEGAASALSIAGGLYNLAYVVSGGLAGAVGIIFGNAVGAGETDKLREYSVTVQFLFLALGVLTGAAMQAAKLPFVSLFGVTRAASRLAVEFINVLSLLAVGTCYQSACLFGLVKSGGDTLFVFKTDAFFVFVVIIPLSLLAAALGAPPWLIFAALKCDQLLKCPVAAFKLRRLDWVRSLVERRKE